MSGGDHGVLGHQCVSLRGEDADLPPLIPQILIWGFAVLLVLVDISVSVRGRLGRSPPWVQPAHLTLAVIRC